MSKFKIEHGASKVNLVLLKTNIEDTIFEDIDLMATWSHNDRKYIVNELLRFALTQEEEFLKYKSSLPTSAAQPVSVTKSAPSPIKPPSDAAQKSDTTAPSITART